jgi:hypothetical protein
MRCAARVRTCARGPLPPYLRLQRLDLVPQPVALQAVVVEHASQVAAEGEGGAGRACVIPAAAAAAGAEPAAAGGERAGPPTAWPAPTAQTAPGPAPGPGAARRRRRPARGCRPAARATAAPRWTRPARARGQGRRGLGVRQHMPRGCSAAAAALLLLRWLLPQRIAAVPSAADLAAAQPLTVARSCHTSRRSRSMRDSDDDSCSASCLQGGRGRRQGVSRRGTSREAGCMRNACTAWARGAGWG